MENVPNIAFCSIHQSSGYPHTGKSEKHGKFNNVLNLPIAPASLIQDYCKLLEQKIIPFFKEKIEEKVRSQMQKHVMPEVGVFY